MDGAMNGLDYVALRRLSAKDDTTLAEVGQTCERVPASSLPGLLASGKIKLAGGIVPAPPSGITLGDPVEAVIPLPDPHAVSAGALVTREEEA
jgi:hypothetical protein